MSKKNIKKRFQLLIQNEGLYLQVIGNFPYPIAIFERNGMLTMAKHILVQRANISFRAYNAKGERVNAYLNIIEGNNTATITMEKPAQ